MIGKRPCFFNAWWWWWWCHCVAGAIFCCARTVKTRVRGGTDGGHRCERVRNENEREGKEGGKWEPLSCRPFDKQQTPKRNEKIYCKLECVKSVAWEGAIRERARHDLHHGNAFLHAAKIHRTHRHPGHVMHILGTVHVQRPEIRRYLTRLAKHLCPRSLASIYVPRGSGAGETGGTIDNRSVVLSTTRHWADEASRRDPGNEPHLQPKATLNNHVAMAINLE